MAVGTNTPEDLTREITRDTYRPVYFFFGEEDYRKIEAVKYILGHYVPQQQRLLNFVRLEAGKMDFEAILAELAAIPMLGERRLIVIDEIQRLKPTQQKRLFGFLKHPSPETVVVLTVGADYMLRKNSDFFASMTQIAWPVQFDRLGSGQAMQKIQKQLEAAGITYDREAVELLVSLTDGDFGGLTGELEKLILVSESGAHIGPEEVKKMSISYEAFSLFELIDLIAERRAEPALRAYQDLIQKGMKPTAILWQLSGHMLNLLRVHTGRSLAGKPYFVNKLKAQARQFDLSQVLAAVSLIAAAERNIRRSGIRPPLLVENLIRRIAG